MCPGGSLPNDALWHQLRAQCHGHADGGAGCRLHVRRLERRLPDDAGGLHRDAHREPRRLCDVHVDWGNRRDDVLSHRRDRLGARAERQAWATVTFLTLLVCVFSIYAVWANW